MIYLASPYTHANPVVMNNRYIQACIACSEIMRRGHLVFSPIAHSHGIAVHGKSPVGWGFWVDMDLHILRLCTEFWILKLPGWVESVGVRMEFNERNMNRRTMTPMREDFNGDTCGGDVEDMEAWPSV